MLPEPLAVTLQVVQLLEQQHIPYVIGGSFASTHHGVARSTLDSDLIIQLSKPQIPALINALQPDFYADADMATEAVQHKTSFNIIHLATMFKVDFFIAKDDAFHRAQLARRIARPIAKDETQQLYFLSAEDTILAKLRWYRLGGDQSERQWSDVIGVWHVQKSTLDFAYIKKMCIELGITDLLDRLVNA